MFDLLRGCDGARVLVVSLRGLLRQVSRCLTYEFEDLVAQLDAVDLVTPARSRKASRWLRRPARWLRGARALLPQRGTDPGRRYELLLVIVEDIGDLEHLGDLQPLLDACGTSLCWVQELWRRHIPARTGELALLRQFEHIAVGCHASVVPLQTAIGRPCFYLPPGIDAIAFHPDDVHAERPIDLFCMGRRSPRTHTALRELCAAHGWFYLFDTYSAGPVFDPVQHRGVLASLVKRSKLFVANRAKADRPAETGGQDEAGYRFFEGAAGGAVLVGDPPHTPAFAELFPWHDAVIELPFDSLDVDVVENLLGDAPRLLEARLRNLEGSLRSHDWAYRWRRVLEAVGLQPLRALRDREAELVRMVAAVRARPALRRSS